MISSRKADACHEVAEGIKKSGGDAHVIPCNISRSDEVKALIAGATKHYGKVDILVCNAAVNPYYGPLLDITDEAFDKIMGSNVKSNIWLCAQAIPQMGTNVRVRYRLRWREAVRDPSTAFALLTSLQDDRLLQSSTILPELPDFISSMASLN